MGCELFDSQAADPRALRLGARALMASFVLGCPTMTSSSRLIAASSWILLFLDGPASGVPFSGNQTLCCLVAISEGPASAVSFQEKSACSFVTACWDWPASAEVFHEKSACVLTGGEVPEFSLFEPESPELIPWASSGCPPQPTGLIPWASSVFSPEPPELPPWTSSGCPHSSGTVLDSPFSSGVQSWPRRSEPQWNERIMAIYRLEGDWIETCTQRDDLN